MDIKSVETPHEAQPDSFGDALLAACFALVPVMCMVASGVQSAAECALCVGVS